MTQTDQRTGTATFVGQHPRQNGDVRIYRLDPPVAYTPPDLETILVAPLYGEQLASGTGKAEHVIVSTIPEGSGDYAGVPETAVWACDDTGTVYTPEPLAVLAGDSHAAGLLRIGYTVEAGA